MRLKNKIAIVTGATKGIGRGIAHRFAEEGAKVIIAGRSVVAGRAVEAEIRQAGGEATFVKTDISLEDDCRNVIEAAQKHYGGLTTFVHSAAATHLIGTQTPTSDARMDRVPNEAMDQIWRSDMYGFFWCCRYALRALLKNKEGGSIVNISSGAGREGALEMDAYVASKAAMNGVTRSMAAEYARNRIRVNAIGTGLINNGGAVEEMLQNPNVAPALRAGIPLPVMGMPDDIAWAAVYLAYDEARYVTGVVLAVDGGISGAAAFNNAPLHEK
jgi:NAD(P)-dependent dehydrogenase (short-subunit alcohol dehydrogenase family)